MEQIRMRKGNVMATVEVLDVDGQYQGTVRIVRASGGTYSHFCRSVDRLCPSPEEAYQQAKTLAASILDGL